MPQVGDVSFPYTPQGVAAAHIYAAISGQPMIDQQEEGQEGQGMGMPPGAAAGGGGAPSMPPGLAGGPGMAGGLGMDMGGYGGPPLSAPTDQGMPQGMPSLPPPPPVAGMNGGAMPSDQAPPVAMHALSVHGKRKVKTASKASSKSKTSALRG